MRTTTIFVFVFALVLLVVPAGGTQNGTLYDLLELEMVYAEMGSGGMYFDGCNKSYTETWGQVWYPNHQVVKPNHISASINITGYSNTSIVDGVEYVCGCPASLAIINKVVSTSHAGFEANKDWVQQCVTIVSTNETTTATLTIKFLWHWTTHSSVTGTNTKHYRFETKTVSVTRPHPKILSTNTSNVLAQITEYNNTFDPYTLIRVDVPDRITATSFKYKNHTAKHFDMVGVVVDEHANFLNNDMWKVSPNQDLIVPYGDQCLIREAPINLSELGIQIHSPYHTENVTRCNITTITSNPTDYVNFKRMFIYILLIGSLAFCTYANLKWVRR
jgi:hypothetical protein